MATRTSAKSTPSLADRVDLAYLLDEWHPTFNEDLTPAHVTPGVSRSVWWVCPLCGDSYEARVSRRSAGSGHRPCVLTRPKPGESLAEVRPDLVAEWDVERNGRLSPGDVRVNATRSAHWICGRGHRWKRDVAGRAVKGYGCKQCDVIARGTPPPGKSLAEARPDLAAEWDAERNGSMTPYDVMPGTGRVTVHWICADGHRWPQTPNGRTNTGPHGEHGCPDCAVIRSKTPRPGESFGDLYPGPVEQWDWERNSARGLDPYAIKPFCDSEADWRCKRGHEWASKVTNRALGNGCPDCTLWGTSMWEIRIRTELEACGVGVVHPHPAITVPGRAPVPADVVIPQHRLVIECDGYGGHRWPDSAEKDMRQTQVLQAAGWTVIRVREGTDAITSLDVCVRRNEPIASIVGLVLDRVQGLGIDAPLDEYARTGPWATDRADALIASLLAASTRSAISSHPPPHTTGP